MLFYVVFRSIFSATMMHYAMRRPVFARANDKIKKYTQTTAKKYDKLKNN